MKRSDWAMQARFRIICILIAQITTFIPHIPCIQKNICSQKLWREPFFLPAIYSIVSVSFKVKPTSHVNMIKLAMAVLWGSKNLWSYIVHFFFVAVFLSPPSFLVSGGWFHYLSYKQVSLVLSMPLCDSTSSAYCILCWLSGGFFNTDKILRGTYLWSHTVHYFLILCPPLWCVRWSTFSLANSTGNGGTVKRSERPRLFQWMCVRRNCHSSYSAAVLTTNCSVDMGKV